MKSRFCGSANNIFKICWK